MTRKQQFGERDWNKRPLFARRRRRPLRWIVLLLLLVCGGLWFLFPNVVPDLLHPLFS